MGMVLTLRRCNEAELQEAKALNDDDAIFDTLIPDEDEILDHLLESGELTDLDKAWHAIHFLLCGEEWGNKLPEGFLLGGEAITDDVGYGPIRILSAADTATIADFLNNLGEDPMSDRWDAALLTKNEIYPDIIWERDGAQAQEYVVEYFNTLREFVRSAANAGQGIAHVIA